MLLYIYTIACSYCEYGNYDFNVFHSHCACITYIIACDDELREGQNVRLGWRPLPHYVYFRLFTAYKVATYVHI